MSDVPVEQLVYGRVPRDEGNEIRQLYILVPETPTSTHYFAGECRPVLRPGDEDFPILQGIQQQLGAADVWSLTPALLAVDAGAVMARRHLASLIARQN